jgi:hypothetical protein
MMMISSEQQAKQAETVENMCVCEFSIHFPRVKGFNMQSWDFMSQ